MDANFFRAGTYLKLTKVQGDFPSFRGFRTHPKRDFVHVRDVIDSFDRLLTSHENDRGKRAGRDGVLRC